ncbi:hypothetical protein QQS21_002831, partial [Conoideocrella luteorostrata]
AAFTSKPKGAPISDPAWISSEDIYGEISRCVDPLAADVARTRNEKTTIWQYKPELARVVMRIGDFVLRYETGKEPDHVLPNDRGARRQQPGWHSSSSAWFLARFVPSS